MIKRPSSQQLEDHGTHLSRRTHASWLTLVVLCAIVSIICSIDRMAMSVAILPMSEQFSFSDTVKGAVNGAFNLGYMVTNLVGGYLAAAYGPKRVLAVGVAVWSTFTILTPPAAASGNLLLLCCVRAVMGLGEGVTFPSLQVLVKTFVPADRRARSLSLVYSGHQGGSIIALLTSPYIINSMGWPWVFYLFGSFGFLWLAAWEPLTFPAPAATESSRKDDDDHGNECADEQQQLEPLQLQHDTITVRPTVGYQKDRMLSDSPKGGRAASTAGVAQLVGSGGAVGGSGSPLHTKHLRWTDVPWRQFALQPACWALLVAHCSFGVCYNTAMSWLPTYYNQAFGVNVRQSALLSVLPFTVMACTTNISGWVADGLVNGKLLNTTKTRKLLQAAGTGFPAACLLYLAGQQKGGSIAAAVGLLTAMLGGMGLQAAGFAANHQDISSKYAGVLYGVTNAGSSLAGSVAVYSVGWALDHKHSWGAVFQCVAWVNVLSLAMYALWGTSVPLFD